MSCKHGPVPKPEVNIQYVKMLPVTQSPGFSCHEHFTCSVLFKCYYSQRDDVSSSHMSINQGSILVAYATMSSVWQRDRQRETVVSSNTWVRTGKQACGTPGTRQKKQQQQHGRTSVTEAASGRRGGSTCTCLRCLSPSLSSLSSPLFPIWPPPPSLPH